MATQKEADLEVLVMIQEYLNTVASDPELNKKTFKAANKFLASVDKRIEQANKALDVYFSQRKQKE